MVFINKTTGNRLIVRNAKTVALMRAQPDTYEEVIPVAKPVAPKATQWAEHVAAPAPVKLAKNLTKDQLEAIALEEDVDLSECTNNEQRRAAIELARETRAQ